MHVVVDANVLVLLALSVPGFDYVADHRLSAPRVGRSEAISAIHEALWRGISRRTTPCGPGTA